MRKFLMITLALVLLPQMSLGQSMSGTPKDLSFTVINATDGQPTGVERLKLEYLQGALQPVFDVEPPGSEFTIESVPLRERGRYLLTAWSHDVPYYWEKRGRDLLDGPFTLHVFDLSNSLADVTITGLDLVMRKTESLLEIEYMMQVNNGARPQVTVTAPLEIPLPAGATSGQLTHLRGMEPQTLALEGLSGRARLAVPLTSGANALRLKVVTEYADGMRIPVGANVRIEAWGLLATPVSLEIRGHGLETGSDEAAAHHIRRRGQPLAAHEKDAFEIHSPGSASTEENLFSRSSESAADADEDSTAQEDSGDGFPFLLLLPILVVIIALVARQMRR